MNEYIKLKTRQQKEVNALPLGFAFSDKQFTEMMSKWGLTVNDTDKIYKLGRTGGFYRKSDSELIRSTIDRHEKEFAEAVASDPDGTGFIKEMFRYELDNHEYSYTGCAEDAIEALGYTWEDIQNDSKLKNGLMLAIEEIGG